ncbi:MAG: hypothetical protein WC284_16620 [Candidimonas sp.]
MFILKPWFEKGFNRGGVGDNFFHPAYLPFDAEYDDYGGFENVVETDNTRFTRNWINLDTLCEEIHDEKSKLGIMMIRRDVYDAVIAMYSPDEHEIRTQPTIDDVIKSVKIDKYGLTKVDIKYEDFMRWRYLSWYTYNQKGYNPTHMPLLKKEMEEMGKIVRMMDILRRPWQPTMAGLGSQDQSFEDHIKLASIVIDVAQKEIDNWNEYTGVEDELV